MVFFVLESTSYQNQKVTKLYPNFLICCIYSSLAQLFFVSKTQLTFHLIYKQKQKKKATIF